MLICNLQCIGHSCQEALSLCPDTGSAKHPHQMLIVGEFIGDGAYVLQGQGGGLHGKGSGVLEFGWSEGWAEGSSFQLVY